jgi:hypothetical protein
MRLSLLTIAGHDNLVPHNVATRRNAESATCAHVAKSHLSGNFYGTRVPEPVKYCSTS